MRIAVATEGGQVAPHFGRCPEYTLFDVAQDRVVSRRVLPNPGHEPGFLPDYLARLGVDVVIAGGMGPRAQGLFAARGVRPVIGAGGRVDDVVAAFLAGTLVTGESRCDHGPGHRCEDHDHS